MPRKRVHVVVTRDGKPELAAVVLTEKPPALLPLSDNYEECIEMIEHSVARIRLALSASGAGKLDIIDEQTVQHRVSSFLITD